MPTVPFPQDNSTQARIAPRMHRTNIHSTGLTASQVTPGAPACPPLQVSPTFFLKLRLSLGRGRIPFRRQPLASQEPCFWPTYNSHDALVHGDGARQSGSIHYCTVVTRGRRSPFHLHQALTWIEVSTLKILQQSKSWQCHRKRATGLDGDSRLHRIHANLCAQNPHYTTQSFLCRDTGLAFSRDFVSRPIVAVVANSPVVVKAQTDLRAFSDNRYSIYGPAKHNLIAVELEGRAQGILRAREDGG